MPAFSRAQFDETMIAKKSDADSSQGHISPGTPTMSHCVSIGDSPKPNERYQACRNTVEPRGIFFLSSAFLPLSALGEILTPPFSSSVIVNDVDFAPSGGITSVLAGVTAPELPDATCIS